VKYNDIVSIEKSYGKCEARVNWVEDGNVGITYLSPSNIKGAASVVKEDELTLISVSAKDEMAERIASISDTDLEERIQNIRRRRFPKATTTYKRKSAPKAVGEKKVSFDDLFKKMAENPNK